jgi:hypothetical protein
MLKSRTNSGCASVVEHRLGEAADRRARVEVLDVDLLLVRADPRVGALEHRDVQPLLAAEVVVEHPLRRAGALGDLVHARARVPVRGDSSVATSRISRLVRSASRRRSGAAAAASRGGPDGGAA